jgi:hypothetical protein
MDNKQTLETGAFRPALDPSDHSFGCMRRMDVSVYIKLRIHETLKCRHLCLDVLTLLSKLLHRLVSRVIQYTKVDRLLYEVFTHT